MNNLRKILNVSDKVVQEETDTDGEMKILLAARRRYSIPLILYVALSNMVFQLKALVWPMS